MSSGSYNPAENPLTPRELEVFELVAEGLTNREIGTQLFIETSTVRWYTKQIYSKLGTSQRNEAVAIGREVGLLASEQSQSESQQLRRLEHNLPLQTMNFVGRRKEIALLNRLLADDDTRLITIHAPGGNGKTRLSIEVARQQIGNFRDGVWFVDLASVYSTDDIITATIDALRIKLQSYDDTFGQLLNYIREKHMLLVLDNFDLPLEFGGIVIDLLQHSTEVKIIVTARERLKIGIETLCPISGLDHSTAAAGGDSVSVDNDAVQLFVQCAQHVQVDFELDESNTQYVRQICEMVDGVPLGIVLAASWLNVLSPKEIVEEIERSIDFLSAQMLDLPQRQWSIRAVFESTWQQLTDVERAVYMKLSIFRDGFTRGAARIVADAKIETLQSLLNKSLVERRISGRYAFHQLLYQYAREQLNASGSLDSTRAAHANYFADLLDRYTTQMRETGNLDSLMVLEGDFENIRDVWNWAVEERHTHIINRMARGLSHLVVVQSRDYDGFSMFQRAADRIDDGALRGRILTYLSELYIYYHGGNHPQAEKLLLQSEASATEFDDRFGLALCLGMLGKLNFSVTDYDRALDYINRSQVIFRELGDRWGIIRNLSSLCHIAMDQGDFKAARDYTEESLSISKELDNRYEMTRNLIDLGYVAYHVGKYDEAVAVLQEALSLSYEYADPIVIANCLNNLGNVTNHQGRFDLAREHIEEGLSLSEESGARWGIARGMGSLGDIALCQGDFDAAHSYYQRALALRRDMVSPWGVTMHLVNVGRATMYQGRYATAMDYLQQGLEAARRESAMWIETYCLVALGFVHLKQGQSEDGRGYLLDALRLFDATGAIPLALEALAGMAMFCLGRGEAERCAELLGLVEGHSALNSETRLHINELRSSLEPAFTVEELERLFERGRGRQLDEVIDMLLADTPDESAG